MTDEPHGQRGRGRGAGGEGADSDEELHPRSTSYRHPLTPDPSPPAMIIPRDTLSAEAGGEGGGFGVLVFLPTNRTHTHRPIAAVAQATK